MKINENLCNFGGMMLGISRNVNGLKDIAWNTRNGRAIELKKSGFDFTVWFGPTILIE